jgi:thymidylate synthase
LYNIESILRDLEDADVNKADKIFIDNCKEILQNGVWDNNYDVRPKWEDGTPAHTIKKFGVVNRYNLAENFPILTLRKTNFRAAIDELLWIWQKKSNNVNELDSHIWDSWADGSGSIGKAYGYQLGIKHKYKEGEFDQVDRVIYDLKNNPSSRRILTNIYNFDDLHEMHLYPCAYSMTFNVSGNKLNAILNQRSQDMLAANNWNVVQYSILLHIMARVSGLEVGELVHVIADAHIYDRHVPIIEELIKNESFDSPRLEIDKSITDFYDFKVENFKLVDYKFNPMKIKVPIAV